MPLSKTEAKVIDYLYTHGQDLLYAAEIAGKLNIKKRTIYDALDSLKRKGIVQEQLRGQMKFYRLSEVWRNVADAARIAAAKPREVSIKRLKGAKGPPHASLKIRLDYVADDIGKLVQRLEEAIIRFSESDKRLFAKVVDAYSKHDMARANAFAKKLAEVRRKEKTTILATIALQRISISMLAVSEPEKIVSTLAPVVDVLRNISNEVTPVFPEAETEFRGIVNLLSGIIMEAGHSTGLNIDFQIASEHAKKIMNEVTTATKKKIKKKLPDLPVEIKNLPKQDDI